MADRDDQRPRLSPIPHDARPHQGHRAGIVSRVMAAVVDAAVVVAILTIAYLAWAALLFAINPVRFSMPRVPFVGWLAAGYLIATTYLAIRWATTGRTSGTHLLGLRVTDDGGRVLRPWRALLRAAFCVVFPVGLLWVPLSTTNRSLADTLLRTSVVYDWRPTRDVAAAQPRPPTPG